MSINIDNITHPNEAFESYKDKLLDVYRNDFKDKDISLFKNRMNNTLYLFDSNPVDMMAFLEEEQDKIDDNNLIFQIEDEYKDYLLVKDRLTRKLNKGLLKIIARYFNIPFKSASLDLLDLDFDSFSLESASILKNTSVGNLKRREEIRERQRDYIHECFELGVKPITNYMDIHFIMEEMARVDRDINLKLLKDTKWGNRIVKKIRSYNPNYSIYAINKILNSGRVASCNYARDSKGNRSGICMYYPIIQDIDKMGLDTILFHENRHVIESGLKSSGLSYYGDDDCYRLFNEIHTEDKAIKDSIMLRDTSIFSNDDIVDSCFSPYRVLIPLTDGLFDEYSDFINEIVYYDDVNYFEKVFGRGNLLDFEKYLESIDCYVRQAKSKSEIEDIIDLDEAKSYVKKIRDNVSRYK